MSVSPPARTALASTRSIGVAEPLESRSLFALVTFTVDPALSSLRLSGEVGDVLDLEEQRSGSLVAAYEGTVVADFEAGSINFPGGSDVAARATRSYSPGDGPANYGAESETGGIFSVKIGEAAVRNFKFDVRTDAALAVTESGAFGASGLDLRTTAGRLEYDLRVGGDGEVDLGDKTVDNNGAGNATLRGTGANLTLTIPIDVNLNEDSAELRLRGTIVANAGTGAPVDPNAVRLGDGSLIKSVSFTDANGTLATISVKGGGSADVRFQNAATQTPGKAGVVVGGEGVALLGVDAVGTTARTKIAIAGKGGADGLVVIPSLTTDGPAASLGGRGVTFGGPVTINGRLGALAAAGLATATVTADSIGATKVTGDVTDSTITLDAPFASGTFGVGKLTVGGAFSRSRITAAGAIGAVKATTLIRSEIYSALTGTPARFPAAADLSAEGSIGNVTSRNFADTVIAADTIGKMKLGTIVVDNEANPFGVTADAFAGLTGVNTAGQKLKLTAQDDPAALAAALAAQAFQPGDFEIRLA
jgi:hypothetical protein